MRVGQGFDIHRFADDDRPLVLSGVHIAGERGLHGHSDADAIAHAVKGHGADVGRTVDGEGVALLGDERRGGGDDLVDELGEVEGAVVRVAVVVVGAGGDAQHGLRRSDHADE